MTENDARIGREIMVDELRTTNAYEALADRADDPKVAEQVRDIAREEKVHTGEGAAIVDANDPEAGDAMREGVSEVRKSSTEPVRPTDTGSKVRVLPSIKDMMGLSNDHVMCDTWKTVRMTSPKSEDVAGGMDMKRVKMPSIRSMRSE